MKKLQILAVAMLLSTGYMMNAATDAKPTNESIARLVRSIADDIENATADNAQALIKKLGDAKRSLMKLYAQKGKKDKDQEQGGQMGRDGHGVRKIDSTTTSSSSTTSSSNQMGRDGHGVRKQRQSRTTTTSSSN